MEQIKLTCTVSGTDYKKKRAIKWTKTYVDNNCIPAGFWMKMLQLSKMGYHVNIPNMSNIVDADYTAEDANDWIDEIEFKKDYIQPRWYQRKALYLAMKYSISRGDFATGAGKTLICYLVARSILERKLTAKGKKVLVVVPSVQLVSQTRDAWINDYQSDDAVVIDVVSGSYSGERNPNGNVILGNIDTLRGFPKSFFKDVGAVIYDEAHKLTTETYKSIFYHLLPNELDLTYSVSGSWYDEDTKGDYECESLSGPLLISVPAHLLMAEGSLSKLRVFEVPFVHNYATSDGY